MEKVTLSLPTLTGGVSQQPPAQRLKSQAQESTNFISRISEGLRKRNPSEHVMALSGAYENDAAASHIIDRGDSERYLVRAKDQELKVWDFEVDDQPLSVTNSAGSPASGTDWDYLDTTDPEKDLKFLTVGDYTLVLNRAITTAMDSALTATRDPEGLVAVRQGNYGTTYTVTVTQGGNTTTATYTTYSADGTPPPGGINKNVQDAERSIQTDQIAQGLVAGLTNAAVPGPWTLVVTRSGPALTTGWTIETSNSVIYLSHASDFDLKTDDSVASTTLVVAKDDVQLFTDLPLTAYHGMRLKVKGDPETEDLGYWVEFEANTSSGLDDGDWVESVEGGVQFGIDADTLPHALIRYSDSGTIKFRWTPLDGHTFSSDSGNITVPSWGERSVGDLETNPDPSFVGEKIRGMFFWKDRLGLLSGEHMVLSEAGELFNFWRTSITVLSDSARIDARAPTDEVVQLNHGVPMAEQLILFSDKVQFVVRGDGAITPTTTQITETTKYESLVDTAPVTVGQAIMVPAQTGSSTMIQEMRDISQNRPQLAAIELTAACPTYLQGIATRVDASPTEKVLAVLTDQEQGSCFLYTWFINGGDRIQSAWQKLSLGGQAAILDLKFIGSWLYLVVMRVDVTGTTRQISVERVNMEPFPQDDGQEFTFALDRRVHKDDLPSVPTYNSVTNETTVVLPYNATLAADTRIVTPKGAWRSALSASGATLTFRGDWTTEAFWVGDTYTATHTLSKQYLQDRDGVPVATGVVRLRQGNVLYEGTGYFRVQVTPRLGNSSVSTYSGVSPAFSQVGAVSVEGGRFRFPCRGRATDLDISIINDSPFPSRLVSMDIEATWMGRGRAGR